MRLERIRSCCSSMGSWRDRRSFGPCFGRRSGGAFPLSVFCCPATAATAGPLHEAVCGSGRNMWMPRRRICARRYPHVVLVGHSMGGLLAMETCRTASGGIDGIFALGLPLWLRVRAKGILEGYKGFLRAGSIRRKNPPEPPWTPTASAACARSAISGGCPGIKNCSGFAETYGGGFGPCGFPYRCFSPLTMSL